MSKSRDIADSAATINYIDGLTSDAQTQLDGKATLSSSPTFTGTVTATAFSGDGSGLTGVDALPSQTGNAGNYLTTDGTNPSWAEISTNPSFEATASGTLANGDTVIVNSDGTISAVASSIADGFTDSVSFAGTGINSGYIDVVSVSGSQVVVAYIDSNNSNYGTAVVGTISGGVITFGTPVVFYSSSSSWPAITYDASVDKVVIAFRDASSYGRAIVGTVSGTSISFGTSVQTYASLAYYFDIASNQAGKVVVSMRKQDPPNGGQCAVGTISGTSISFSSVHQFASSLQIIDTAITYDSSADKFIIIYKDSTNNNGLAVVGTVSGSTISYGSTATFFSGNIGSFQLAYDSNANKTIIAYPDVLNSNYGTAIVGTVSGTSISFGTPVAFTSNAIQINGVAFNSNSNKVEIYFGEGSPSIKKMIRGTASGTSISFDSVITSDIEANATQTNQITYNSTEDVSVVTYSIDDGSNTGASSVIGPITTTNLTAENYIGISDAAYSDGATAKIQIAGSVDDAQSGLTAGQRYYVQIDGSLSASADDPSVVAGTAVSASKLIVKG